MIAELLLGFIPQGSSLPDVTAVTKGGQQRTESTGVRQSPAIVPTASEAEGPDNTHPSRKSLSLAAQHALQSHGMPCSASIGLNIQVCTDSGHPRTRGRTWLQYPGAKTR